MVLSLNLYLELLMRSLNRDKVAGRSHMCLMRKRNTPAFSERSSNKFPVTSQKASKSATAPGSVASTSSVPPLGTSDMTFLVLRIGSGQLSPLVSSSLSAIADLSGSTLYHLR